METTAFKTVALIHENSHNLFDDLIQRVSTCVSSPDSTSSSSAAANLSSSSNSVSRVLPHRLSHSSSSGSDVAQGVQAQNVANFYIAFESNLTIIPVINKIDQPTADPFSNLLSLQRFSPSPLR
ncbi:hypothetical protein ACFX14_029630 [Malus domestica]